MSAMVMSALPERARSRRSNHSCTGRRYAPATTPSRSATRISPKRRTNRKTASTVAAAYTTARLASPNVTSPRRFRSSACAISALTLTRGLSLESVFKSTKSRRKVKNEKAEGRTRLAQELLMQGKWFLKDQVDSSHTFLYGHRFWPEVKRAVTRAAESKEPHASHTLAGVVREVAHAVAAERGTDESLAV